jgi:hypothetical protein
MLVRGVVPTFIGPIAHLSDLKDEDIRLLEQPVERE